MKLAIIHDFLNQYGGAEKCVEAFHEIFPDAPVYTSIYLPGNLPESFRGMDIRTSFMQKLPLLKRHFKKYLALYPRAMESFDLEEYDVLLSSSSAFAKGAKKGRKACHICYCYSPMRFVWDYKNYVEKENLNGVIKRILPFTMRSLKKWDLRTNKRVDHFVAISKHISKRIENCYQRTSDIIYPPVSVADFKISNNIEDYYLVVSRLNAYKRIDLVIEAFNKLKLPLRIIGDGPFRNNLKQKAGPTIKFLGKVDDRMLVENYQRCRGFIFPGQEDFGIAPVEAQAAGRPVIAYAAGGALETVIDGVTGVFFHDQTKDALCDAVRRFVSSESAFSSMMIRENAKRFDKETFKHNIEQYIRDKSGFV